MSEDDIDDETIIITPSKKINTNLKSNKKSSAKSDTKSKTKSKYTKGSDTNSDVDMDSGEDINSDSDSDSDSTSEETTPSKKNSKSKTNKNTDSEETTPSKKNSKSNKNTDSDKNVPENKSDDEFEILCKFMRKYVNEKGKKGVKFPYNYTTMDAPFYSCNIPDDMINKFFDLYVDAIVAGKSVTITERHKDFGPIVIDLDFLQTKENNQRYYTLKTIKNCIRIYNNIIRRYLDVPDENMISYVTEKECPSFRKGEYHDGVHIMYPNICTAPALQMLMRKDFIKQLEKKNVFRKIPLVNSLDKVVDENVIYQAGWLLYGSRKSHSVKGYQLTHVYETFTTDDNSMVINDTFETEFADRMSTKKMIKSLVRNLSVRKFNSENDLTPWADNVDPEIINEKSTQLKNTIIEKKGADQAERLIGSNINFIKATSERELIEAKNLVKLFSKARASDYYQWYQVGMCLHNIDYRLLEDWIEFSKKCPNKFNKGECEKLWKKMKPSVYNMASVHYYASTDNPKEYVKLYEGKLTKLVKECENIMEHHTVANLLMSKYQFRFKCASIKHNLWYEFKNHRWVKIDDAYTLRNLMSDDLTQLFADRQRALYTEASQKTGKKQKKISDKAGEISKIIKQLNNNNFKNGVIKECANIAYDPTFLKNLDENINLLCFENGVYDLAAKHFRVGCPDDYISLCTNYAYIEYNPDDEYVIGIDDFLNKIQPDQEMKDYLLRLLSTCLAGSIKEESFYVMTGGGGNGKSKLMELLRYALGDYFKTMDVRLLTEKRSSSSSASPEVADKKGIRACTLDEPNANDQINTGFMKLFTGGDEITARALFQEPIYFKPQFKPFLLCNKLPNISSDDDGTWRRLKVIPFGSKFIKPSDMTKKQKKTGLPPNTFLADLSLSEKLVEWKQSFMSMLIEAYKGYSIHGLKHPKAVLKETRDYQKRCDVYQDFITDSLDKTDKKKDTISVMNLHDLMKKWYKSNYDGKCPNAKELRNYLEKRTDNYIKNRDTFFGYKIKSLDNEELAGDLDDMDD